MPLPQRFASRADATAAGCLFGNLKGPRVDACILGAYAGSALRLFVYDGSRNGAYAVSNEMVVPSKYRESALSLIDMLGKHTDWLVIETTGMHGTNIGQRVLFVIGWDGNRFRAMAAESLDYHCLQPSSLVDYALHVRHAFKPLHGMPGLILDYELTEDGQSIGKWSDQLRFNASQFAFAPYQSTVVNRSGLDPPLSRVRDLIGRVRMYSAGHPMNPTDNMDDWMGKSELMDTLAPGCSPSLLYLTRDFSGKWILDRQRTAAAKPCDSIPAKSVIVGSDFQVMHFFHPAGDSDPASVIDRASIEDIYRLNGKETSVPVRLPAGGVVRATAKAAMDGKKMIVTIKVDGWSELLHRSFYRDGLDLVIEESGGAGVKSVAYYQKS